MHTPLLLRDLAVILGTAGVVTFLFRKMRQPVVLGYVVAGIIVGPFTPPYPLVKDLPNIQIWSELGVIFLMFALGLEFTFHKLKRVGVSAGGTAFVEVISMGGLGFLTGQLLNWNFIDSLFLGGMLSISSTTIIIKALEELNLKTRKFSEIVFGVLIVEDLFAILILVLLSTIGSTGELLLSNLVFAAIKLAFIVGSWFLIGYFFIPSFFKFVGKFLDDEALIVLSIGLCLSLVVLATYFHYSAALGAFIMGSILAETEQAHRIESLVKPIKSLFAAVFFVSVGMLVNPKLILQYWYWVLIISLVTIIGKILSSSLGALISGQSAKRSIQIGFSLAQIGEFSFIIATLGLSLNAISDFLYPVAVAVSIVTTFATPYLIKISEPVGLWVEKKLSPVFREALRRYGERLQTKSPSDTGMLLQLLRFFGCGIAASVVFILTAKYGTEWFEQNFSEWKTYVGVFVWSASILFSAPFIWGMFFSFQPLDGAKQALGGLQWLIPILGRLATILWLGVVSAFFLKTFATVIVMAVAASLLFFAFYRRLEVSYRWIERRFVNNINSNKETHRDEILDALAPWDLHLVRIIVHPNSAFVGRSLADIDVRNLFGLNIVVIHRGHQMISPPVAKDVLFPMDTLLVLGTDEQIENFSKNISIAINDHSSSSSLTAYTLERHVIEESSSFKGQTIRDSRLREKLNALVVGLERKEKRYLNPNPTLPLEVGDVLWLVESARS